MTDPNLHLEAEIMVSALRGEGPGHWLSTLDAVLAVAKRREAYLASRETQGWAGDRTVVTIAPSSEVLSDYQTSATAMVLGRTGRKCGIDLRLLDTTRPLRPADKNAPEVYQLATFGGNATLRYLATSPDATNITVHILDDAEMSALATNGACERLVLREEG